MSMVMNENDTVKYEHVRLNLKEEAIVTHCMEHYQHEQFTINDMIDDLKLTRSTCYTYMKSLVKKKVLAVMKSRYPHKYVINPPYLQFMDDKNLNKNNNHFDRLEITSKEDLMDERLWREIFQNTKNCQDNASWIKTFNTIVSSNIQKSE